MNKLTLIRCGSNTKECECRCGYTCGGPGSCELEIMECVDAHFKRDCGHVFEGWIKLNDGGTSVCNCGMTSIDHDMWVGP